jgi:tetratricopeptide (TPR) repeat protein
MSKTKDTTNLRRALGHAAELIKENPKLAEKQIHNILKLYPDEPNVLNLLGVAQRLAGKTRQSLKTLEQLVTKQPGFGIGQLEYGLTLQALGNTRQAQAALERAMELVPQVAAGWKALGDVRAANGDMEGSEKAFQNQLLRDTNHHELEEVAKLSTAGNFGKAESICREFLKRHPKNVSAIRLLADIGVKLGRLDDAEALLRLCLDLAPDYHMARYNYAVLLFQKEHYEQALTETDRLIEAAPEHPSQWMLKAVILDRIGNHEAAIEIYQEILSNHPNLGGGWLNLGHTLKTLGKQNEAVDAYRNAIKVNPGMGEAYWSLANLKSFRFDADTIETMSREASRTGGTTHDYYHLYFSLGKALEDERRYEEAFKAYSQGNRIRRKTVHWDMDDHQKNTQQLIEFFKPGLFAEREGQGCMESSPVFIVGLPRSGSTLLEQILASHSQVEGTMELPHIAAIARRLSGKKKRDEPSLYPQVLADLNPVQLRELGEEYLERTRVYRTETPFFIDKMPNNFSHIGMIHLILPNAKIIDARRHPMACCFSGYKQLFASGQNFTYDLPEIGRYYRDYLELMSHWDKVLPGRILRMDYENVVTDIESEVHRLLDYCGLPYENSCLEFYKTERAVRTASSEQVRQPLYTGAIEQWRNFEPWLGPLAEALGPDLIRQANADEKHA